MSTDKKVHLCLLSLFITAMESVAFLVQPVHEIVSDRSPSSFSRKRQLVPTFSIPSVHFSECVRCNRSVFVLGFHRLHISQAHHFPHLTWTPRCGVQTSPYSPEHIHDPTALVHSKGAPLAFLSLKDKSKIGCPMMIVEPIGAYRHDVGGGTDLVKMARVHLP